MRRKDFGRIGRLLETWSFGWNWIATHRMVNPTIVVTRETQCDAYSGHRGPRHRTRLVVTASWATSSRKPMMIAAQAFDGSALWFVGDPASAGRHEGRVRFIANANGTSS